MPFFAASEAPPRPESMKFPVFSLLAGNLAFSETSSQLTPPSRGESAANLPQPGPAIRRAVSFLLRHAPSHLHLVLTTRLEPPLSLGGLLAKNQLLEVDASVLRFDYSFARP